MLPKYIGRYTHLNNELGFDEEVGRTRIKAREKERTGMF
jgi:hypothetical protein